MSTTRGGYTKKKNGLPAAFLLITRNLTGWEGVTSATLRRPAAGLLRKPFY